MLRRGGKGSISLLLVHVETGKELETAAKDIVKLDQRGST